MTHSNHRRGSVDSLSHDFVVMMMAAKGVNDEGAGPKIQRFIELALSNGAVNCAVGKAGNMHTASPEAILDTAPSGIGGMAAFDSAEKLANMLTALTKADLGISVIVSGLFDMVDDCCSRAGIKRHTIEYSLGIWGKTSKLPDEKLLEVSTMCGHAMVSPKLVQRMVKDIQRGVHTIPEAAIELAKPCTCGIFNPKRAEELLQAMVASSAEVTAQNLISIDASKCDKCYACEAACLEAHPDHNKPLCIVDASLGPGVSLHCLHCGNAACLKACPTGNIYREERFGVVAMHGNLCIGCKQCVMACPFGMIVWDQAKGVSTKCDMCLDRLYQGQAPACVEGCPTGSLSVPDTMGVAQKQRQLALATTMATWDRSAEVPTYDYQAGEVRLDAETAARVQAAVEQAKRAGAGKSDGGR
ncbi:MAG: 4Fe-4S dicluster domain-containing protein [Bacteroidetes bacterium]|nr:4Fe-4S dicluster domain-containing protein [Bacteroidota bacterium]MCL5025913.1 4Fe-4S dicluster domain-containing protein [Chloroflexota bacterium]